MDKKLDKKIRYGIDHYLIEEQDRIKANKFVRTWHRHNKNVVPKLQFRFALAIWEVRRWGDSYCFQQIGCIIVGNPCGRFKNKNNLEFRRVCFSFDFRPTMKNGMMFARNSKSRVKMLSYQKGLWNLKCKTYTLPSFIIRCAVQYLKERYKNVKNLYSYTTIKESGSYYTYAGWKQDHIVKGNGLGWQSRKGRKKFKSVDKKRFVLPINHKLTEERANV